jgi:hypothetical protein
VSAGIPVELCVIDAEPAISPDVIERLTELTKAIEKDEVSSIGIAVVYRDGSTGTCWSTPPSYGLLIAAVAHLQHRLLQVGD